jgi:UDPglucose 6-dehydrogenase
VRVSVIGLGKLGSPMAACFAAKGITTIGVDVNAHYVEALNEGRAPVFEPGLEEMIAAGRACLTATTDTVAAVTSSDATFVIVPTPSDDEGGFSLVHVLEACAAIGQAIREKSDYHLVVLTSTVMPGATAGPVRWALEEESGKRAGVDFGLCYSPEFVALGSVIRDFLNPDFLLIGESDETAGDVLVARLSFVDAELTKLAVNTFVTTKIAFANTLARMCEQLPGASVDEVTTALGLDSRIGARYLRGAISYGGPCFPRDNAALASLARRLGTPALVAEATDTANRAGIGHLADTIVSRLPQGGTAGILGLAYKPNTDVVVESPGLLLALALAERDVAVIAYDPAAVESAKRVTGGRIRYADSEGDCIRESDVVAITTAWSEFTNLEPALLERDPPLTAVIDCWRLLDPDRFDGALDYVALGEGYLRPSVLSKPA